MKALIYCCIVSLVACANHELSGDQNFYTWVDEFGVAHVETRKVKNDQALNSEQADNEQHVKKSKPSAIIVNEHNYISSEVIDAKLNQDKHFSWIEDGRVMQQVVSMADAGEVTSSAALGSDTSLQVVNQSWVDNLDFNKSLSFKDASNKELNLAQLYTYDNKSEIDYLIIELPTFIQFKKLEVKSLLKSHSIALPAIKFLTADLKQLPIPFVFDKDYQETWASYAYLSGEATLHSEAAFMVVHSSKVAAAPIQSLQNAPVSDLGFLVIQAL